MASTTPHSTALALGTSHSTALASATLHSIALVSATLLSRRSPPPPGAQLFWHRLLRIEISTFFWRTAALALATSHSILHFLLGHSRLSGVYSNSLYFLLAHSRSGQRLLRLAVSTFFCVAYARLLRTALVLVSASPSPLSRPTPEFCRGITRFPSDASQPTVGSSAVDDKCWWCGEKVADLPSPFHRVQGLVAPDQEVVGRHREGARVEAPTGPLGQVAVEGEVYRGCFGFPWEYRGRVHQHQKEASGGGGRSWRG